MNYSSLRTRSDASGFARRNFLLVLLSAPTAIGATVRDLAPNPAERERLRAEARSQLCTSSNVRGEGLRGEYFAAPNPDGVPLLVRIDAAVDFGGNLEWPANLKRSPPKSIRWTGWVKPPISGIYRFHMTGQLATVRVANSLVSSSDVAMPAAVMMTAGRFYPISISVTGVSLGKETPRLEWTTPYGSRFVVPQTLLYVPSTGV